MSCCGRRQHVYNPFPSRVTRDKEHTGPPELGSSPKDQGQNIKKWKKEREKRERYSEQISIASFNATEDSPKAWKANSVEMKNQKTSVAKWTNQNSFLEIDSWHWIVPKPLGGVSLFLRDTKIYNRFHSPDYSRTRTAFLPGIFPQFQTKTHFFTWPTCHTREQPRQGMQPVKTLGRGWTPPLSGGRGTLGSNVVPDHHRRWWKRQKRRRKNKRTRRLSSVTHSKAEWSSFINHPGQSPNMYTNTRRKTVFVTGWRGTRGGGGGWHNTQWTAALPGDKTCLSNMRERRRE